MNRLRELQRAEKLTQQELADIAEVSKRTIQNWEDGTSNIKPEKAEKLADYFGVSVGYLLGYDDNDINQMNRLKELRKEKGLTQTDLAELLEVTKLTIHNWENGVSSIKSDRLKKLCEIFDVDVPYLLGYDTVKNETDPKVSVLDEALENIANSAVNFCEEMTELVRNKDKSLHFVRKLGKVEEGGNRI